MATDPQLDKRPLPPSMLPHDERAEPEAGPQDDADDKKLDKDLKDTFPASDPSSANRFT